MAAGELNQVMAIQAPKGGIPDITPEGEKSPGFDKDSRTGAGKPTAFPTENSDEQRHIQ